jgi:predicted hydrocarbon binding protein
MDAISFDAATNTATLGNQPLVFHCHHYNCALQRAIEEGLGADAPRVLTAAAKETVRLQLAALKKPGDDARAVVSSAEKLFAELGFGKLDATRLSARGGQADVAASHYAMGWVAKYGERSTPTCYFVAGYLAATVCVAWDLAPERVRVTESGCYACKAERCTFQVEVL